MMTCRHEDLGRPDAGGADLNDVVAVGEGEADGRHELVRWVPVRLGPRAGPGRGTGPAAFPGYRNHLHTVCFIRDTL